MPCYKQVANYLVILTFKVAIQNRKFEKFKYCAVAFHKIVNVSIFHSMFLFCRMAATYESYSSHLKLPLVTGQSWEIART